MITSKGQAVRVQAQREKPYFSESGVPRNVSSAVRRFCKRTKTDLIQILLTAESKART